MNAVLEFLNSETLDARLSSKTGGEPVKNAQPSRWNTPEYYLYYMVFICIPPFMFKAVYDVSVPEHPNYPKYERLLSPGWILGRKVDNSDAQYHGFRGNLRIMALLLVLHPLLRRAYEFLASMGDKKPVSGSSSGDDNATVRPADTRLRRRANFDIFFAMIYLTALNGVSLIKILTILWLNFQVATRLPKKAVPIATWSFNIGLMFANEIFSGYKFADLAGFMLPDSVDAQGNQALNWGARLDRYSGLIPRWQVLFNITVLRLIAFNFDYLWMHDRRASDPIEKKNLDPANLPERERTSIGANPEDFTFRNYLAYVLYSPLYLAGPVINFNDYISQVRYQLPSIRPGRIIPYALRFGLCLLTMELVLHFFYAVAISKANPDWSTYTPFQLSMLGYFNLHIIWLKLLLPWRLFRLWALIDGIDPPENMVRCMSDNYSALSFWRGWHRSFNLWIMRYIYVPLGGSKVSKPRAVLNYLLVFTFVALWHDINLRLLMWGWLVVLFVLPEIIATWVFPAKKWANHPTAYRYLCGLGGVANILAMMSANLVGFAIGLEGVQDLWHGIVSSLGGRFLVLAVCSVLFVATQIMFEVREKEKRRGVSLKF